MPALRIPGLDPFILKILLAVVLASVLPVHGVGATLMGWVTTLAVALLFFLHGARLARRTVLEGLLQWRLHLAIVASTFVLFPLVGRVLQAPLEPLVTPQLYVGVLFLCALPSTVQSAIAFTSIARGNVPAAICSASASSLLGVFITPLLVGLMISGSEGGAISFDAVGRIMLQLLLPFALGQWLQPRIGEVIRSRQALLKSVDQGSILLVVYTAFSEAVVQGLWRETPVAALVGVLVVSAVLLAVLMALTWGLGRLMGLSLADRITLLFCGSKKSLAAGVPMAHVLFAGAMLGSVVLPMMIFHQLQLMVCAAMAARWGRRPPEAGED